MTSSQSSKKPDKPIRPTKKQRDLLNFIESFITEHGYSPSYREIKDGLSYNSVATVALHINSLIGRGHLKKRDYSARSLEVVPEAEISTKLQTNQVEPGEEKWLVEKVEYFIHTSEQTGELTQAQVDELYILLETLRILGIDGAAQSFTPRIAKLKDKL